MPIRDLTGRELGFGLHVEHGLGYEYLVSLCGFATPAEHETYESGREWFEKFRTQASRDLLDALDRIGTGAGKVWMNLVGMATVPPPTRDVPALLERIEGLDPLELRLYLLGFHVPFYQHSISREVLHRAAIGDEDAQQQLHADSSYFGGEAKSLRLLGLSVKETRDVALKVMHRWYDEAFRARESEFEPILLRDAEAKRKLVRRMLPEQVIEAATGIQFVPQPGIRHVYLIPQLTTRPWVWLAEHDEARLYCYPVADESLAGEGTDPPGRLVRLHRALSDEKRLRMLRAIAESSATLQELADRFGLPKSTAHHHLAILRSAGLVTVSSDQERRYRVRRDVIPEVSSLLDAYLQPAQRRA